MTMIAGVLQHASSVGAERLARTLAAESARFPGLSYRQLLHADHASVFEVFRESLPPRMHAWTTRDGHRACLVGEANYGRAAAAIADGTPMVGLHDADLPAAWIACEITPSAVRLASDALGIAWLYFAPIEDGYAFASDYGALARLIGSGLRVDVDTLLCSLGAGYSPDDKTLHQQIEAMPAGSVIELGAGGFKVLQQARAEYGARFAVLSREAKLALWEEVLDASIAEAARSYEQLPVLSLSAGYDSRYLLGGLERRGELPKFYTFGNPLSDEVRGAQRVSARVDATTQVFDIPPGRWEPWRQMVQSLGNVGIVQWCGWGLDWLGFLRQESDACFIGYLGDALSGKHLGATDRDDWVGYWYEWSTAGAWVESRHLRENARKRMAECLRARFGDCARRANMAFPHQRALHLDLYGRQRRWVAAQPNLMARFLAPVIPFYDRRMLAFWSNLPLEDLLDQRLYLDFATERLPRLFPAAERRRPGLRARSLARARKLLQRVAGKPSGPAPIVIDHRRAIEPNREAMLALIARTRTWLDELIETDRVIACLRDGSYARDIGSGNLLRLINVMHLLDLGNAGRDASRAAHERAGVNQAVDSLS